MAEFQGKKLPVTCHDIIAWMARQPLQFRPGEEVRMEIVGLEG